MDLTDTETAILELERSWWRYAGAKDERIVQQPGLTPARYYQLLGALIDRPEATGPRPDARETPARV